MAIHYKDCIHNRHMIVGHWGSELFEVLYFRCCVCLVRYSRHSALKSRHCVYSAHSRQLEPTDQHEQRQERRERSIRTKEGTEHLRGFQAHPIWPQNILLSGYARCSTQRVCFACVCSETWLLHAKLLRLLVTRTAALLLLQLRVLVLAPIRYATCVYYDLFQDE